MKQRVMSLIDRFVKLWKDKMRRAKWPAERQIEWMAIHVREDHQWLCHDPVARAITERHLEMLQREWQTVSVESISEFRKRIGLRPEHGA